MAHAATTVNLTKEPTPIKTIKLTEAIDCEQFNDATKLFRVTALSLKFMRKFKGSKKLEKRAAKDKTYPDSKRDQRSKKPMDSRNTGTYEARKEF